MLSSRERLRSFFDTLVPLLLQCWVEVSPDLHDMTLSGNDCVTYVNDMTLSGNAPLTYVTDMTLSGSTPLTSVTDMTLSGNDRVTCH